jgi:hypothetical protein
MSVIVESWFGDAFEQLHPLLRQLHRDGGTLTGQVQIQFGRGLAGIVGKRLARQLGIPPIAGSMPLEVCIHGGPAALHWDRTFGDGATFASVFTPAGSYPSGHWVESSGALRLKLGVAIVDGGWEWQPRGGWLWGVPIPPWLLPHTSASKRIEQGGYRFTVRVRVPMLGQVLCYSGILAPQ